MDGQWSGRILCSERLAGYLPATPQPAFIDSWNDHPHPFAWTKDAAEILASIRRAETKTSRGLTGH